MGVRIQPNYHVFLTGEYGSGKSTMAATFPARRKEGKVMRVYGFDPPGKMWPYVKSCGPDAEVKKGKTKGGVRYTRVLSEDREVWIYHFPDLDPEEPTGWEDFTKLYRSLNHDKSDTEVFDCCTSAAKLAINLYKYKLWPRPKGHQPKRGDNAPVPAMGATDELEEMLCCRMAGLDCNVVVTAHFSDKEVEFQGALVRAANVPGRLRRTIGGFFEEAYHIRVVKLPSGRRVRFLQTEGDEQFAANTAHDVPNYCEPSYQGIVGKRVTKFKKAIIKELGED